MDINAMVAKDLEHIPKGPYPQGPFRAIYQVSRAHYLGRKARAPRSRAQVMREVIALAERHFPGHRFSYDRGYFQNPPA